MSANAGGDGPGAAEEVPPPQHPGQGQQPADGTAGPQMVVTGAPGEASAVANGSSSADQVLQFSSLNPFASRSPSSCSSFQSKMRKNTSFKITSIAKSRPPSNEESGDESAEDTEDISDNVDNSSNGAAQHAAAAAAALAHAISSAAQGAAPTNGVGVGPQQPQPQPLPPAQPQQALPQQPAAQPQAQPVMVRTSYLYLIQHLSLRVVYFPS